MTGASNPQQQAATGAVGEATPRERLGITDREFQEMGRLGAMFYEAGDLERAQIVFEGLVEVDPTSSAAHAALGALLVRTRQDDRALEHLHRALTLDPKQVDAYVNRGEVYLRKQELKSAIADLKRAIELDPTEQDPAANRARVIMNTLYQSLKAKGAIS